MRSLILGRFLRASSGLKYLRRAMVQAPLELTTTNTRVAQAVCRRWSFMEWTVRALSCVASVRGRLDDMNCDVRLLVLRRFPWNLMRIGVREAYQRCGLDRKGSDEYQAISSSAVASGKWSLCRDRSPRVVISAPRDSTRASSVTAPRSRSIPWARTLTVPASASRGPTTSR